MSKFIFLFDLDSTITKKEILPTVAKEVEMFEKMASLTERTMKGELPFVQSFIERVELLKSVPVSRVQEIIYNIELNERLVEFIQKYKNRCYIVTGNLDIWIYPLMRKIGMENNFYSSKAIVEGDYIQSVLSVINKEAIIRQMVLPFVAVGDGNNDAQMIEAAEVGIGYGAVRKVAPSVLECATHVVYQEDKLVDFLERLV